VLRLIRTADQLVHGERADADSVRKRLQTVDSRCEQFTMRLDDRRKNLVMARNFFAHAQAVSATHTHTHTHARTHAHTHTVSVVSASSLFCTLRLRR